MPTWMWDIFTNDLLWIPLITSSTAQFLKPVTWWWRTREFDWHRMSETGGMPSSHSAMVSSLATGLGIEQGFHSPYFTIAVIMTMIVTYDAQGVRRQAGDHARALNEIVAELLSGHPLQEKHFQEVLGHSRMEVLAGVLFGITTMLLWKSVFYTFFVR